MITGLMRFLQRCLSALFPRWSQPLPVNGHLSLEDVLLHVERALTGNLTFFLEKGFRNELVESSRRWVANETTYGVFCSEVSASLEERPSWGRLIPSYGIYQCLSSIGFFGSTSKGSLGMRWEVPSGALYFSSWVRHPYSLGKALRKEMSNTTKGILVPFSREVETFLRNASASKTGLEKSPAFLVGPGEVEFEFDRAALEISGNMVHLLCTESVPLSSMLTRFPTSRVRIILNNTLANMLVSGSTPLDELLRDQVEIVYCGPQFSRPLEDLGLRTGELVGGLGALWLRGAPSLLARAISHLCTSHSVIHVDGVDLYSRQALYPVAQEGDSAHQGREFVTLTSQAKHDLLFNYNIISRLEASGIVSASPFLKDVLRGGELNYRLALEKSIGALRK